MKNKKLIVKGFEISIISKKENDYISLTDMLKAKDGDFFHLRLAEKQKYR